MLSCAALGKTSLIRQRTSISSYFSLFLINRFVQVFETFEKNVTVIFFLRVHRTKLVATRLSFFLVIRVINALSLQPFGGATAFGRTASWEKNLHWLLCTLSLAAAGLDWLISAVPNTHLALL